MRVTLKRQLVHQCPYVNETDVGTLEIVFEDAEAPELHELGFYLDEFKAVRISSEELTQHIKNYCGSAATVTTRWDTAGFDFTVTA